MSRPRCPDCTLPLARCLCALVRPVAHRTRFHVLQHPAERAAAKGSLGLLQRCLQHCKVEVGEQWPAPPWPLEGCWLLYPGGEAAPADAAPHSLLLLDASWRHSRKLLHRNPWLNALPRYALRAPPPSRYGLLRKAHAPQQLSSLEAVAQALEEIEGNGAAASALRAAFDDWLKLQLRARPSLQASASGTAPCP